MINNSYDQEGDVNRQILSNPNPIQRRYSGFKNPRIVRVSRDFGGKDRHSKVWTVKGLRDRRIRLSVPTAIELYQLQDQLGLNQPSKVIDWLLDVTKEDIDALPPLQMALEDFNRFHLLSTNVPQDFSSTKLSFSPFSNTSNYDHQRTKGKEAIVENKLNSHNYHDLQPSSNLSLSRSSQSHKLYTYLPSSSASPTEPQILSYFPGTASPSFSPPDFMPNHFQLLNSSSQHVTIPLNLIDTESKLPFILNMNSKVSSESNENG